MAGVDQTTGAVLAALSAPRMGKYLAHCGGDRAAAVRLYAWNVLVSAAFWESLSHVEVVMRNAIVERLADRHRRHGRAGSWLDDPARELDARARADIEVARRRVRRKRKPASDGQTLAELSFAFWRFLLAKQYATTLWPDVASAFPHAPNRTRSTVERPVERLYDFRNRIAHHEPIWNKELSARQADLYLVLGYLDPQVQSWVRRRCRISSVLAACPVARPLP